MTRLERNAQRFQVLNVLTDAYESGDFTEVVPLLAEECIYESMWVLQPLHGRKAVADYLLGKGKTLRRSGAFPSCRIVELVGTCNPIPNAEVTAKGERLRAAVALVYEAGKLCLMMKQRIDGKTNEVLMDLTLTEDGLVKRIDLCMPELFHIRDFFTYVTLIPANDETENQAAKIRISAPYYNELYLFFALAGLEFFEYDDFSIPVDKWVKVLAYWKEFAEAEDYDTIAEKFAGIAYDRWSVSNEEVLAQLSQCGAALWRNRKINAVMLNDLLEWTQRSCGDYASIHIYGF